VTDSINNNNINELDSVRVWLRAQCNGLRPKINWTGGWGSARRQRIKSQCPPPNFYTYFHTFEPTVTLACQITLTDPLPTLPLGCAPVSALQPSTAARFSAHAIASTHTWRAVTDAALQTYLIARWNRPVPSTLTARFLATLQAYRATFSEQA
jgi:hypothetical protein